MLRSFDLVLIGVMTTMAVVTYSIKHRADEKLTEVRRLETEIKLEHDTIDLLKADWALLTQPNRLLPLTKVYDADLGLAATQPTQLAMPQELPMNRAQLPQPETTIEDIIAGKSGEVAAALKGVEAAKATPAPKIPLPLPRGWSPDVMSTGSVQR
jgi:hypothetical protein